MKRMLVIMLLFSFLGTMQLSLQPLPAAVDGSPADLEDENPVLMKEQNNPAPAVKKKKSATPIIIGLLAAGAVAALAFVLLKKKGDDQDLAEPDPAVFSQGQVTVPGTGVFDLDQGKVQLDSSDFWWSQETSIIRKLVPENGATFFVIGSVDFNSINYSMLKNYAYTANVIDGSNNASNKIPAGTVIAARTSEGRYAKFRIDVYGYNLTITYLTFSKP